MKQQSITQKLVANIGSWIGAIPRRLNFEPELPERKSKDKPPRRAAKKKPKPSSGSKGGNVIPLKGAKPRSRPKSLGMKKPAKRRNAGGTSRKKGKAA